MFLLFYTKTVGLKLIYFIKKQTLVAIFIIKSPLEDAKQNIPYNLAKCIIVFVLDEAKMKEKLSKIETQLPSWSLSLSNCRKSFFNAKLQRTAPKKEKIVILSLSTHYSNFNSKSIPITVNSLLTNVKITNWKSYFENMK